MRVFVLGIQPDYVGGASVVEHAIKEHLIKFTKMEPSVEFLFEDTKSTWTQRIVNNLDLLITEFVFAEHNFVLMKLLGRLLPRYSSSFEKSIISRNCDLVLSFGVIEKMLLLRKVPYFVCIWDLGHALHPTLPEYTEKMGYEKREYVLGKVARRAKGIFTASSSLSEAISLRFGVERTRLFSQNFFISGSRVNCTERHNFNAQSEDFNNLKDYVIYPANFYEHKNHSILLETLHEMKLRGIPRRHLVLTGKDMGTLNSVLSMISTLELEGEVTVTGFQSVENLCQLIRGASWLAMPSILGPSNLPPLEALLLGVPCAIASQGQEQFPSWPFVLICESDSKKDWIRIFDFGFEPPLVEKSLVVEYNALASRKFLTTLNKIFTNAVD